MSARGIGGELVEAGLEPGAGGIERLLLGQRGAVRTRRAVAHQIIAAHPPVHGIGADLKQQGEEQ